MYKGKNAEPLLPPAKSVDLTGGYWIEQAALIHRIWNSGPFRTLDFNWMVNQGYVQLFFTDNGYSGTICSSRTLDLDNWINELDTGFKKRKLIDTGFLEFRWILDTTGFFSDIGMID